MSFAKRMNADRPRALMSVLAAAASISLSGAVAAPPVVENSVGAQQQEAPRDFVDEKNRRKRAPAPVHNKVKGGGLLKRRVDSRKGRRRLIMAMLRTENSGRQWVRARRGLRKTDEGRFVLGLPAWRLAQIAQRMGVI